MQFIFNTGFLNYASLRDFVSRAEAAQVKDSVFTSSVGWAPAFKAGGHGFETLLDNQPSQH